MILELEPGEMAVLVGALGSHIGCIARDLERPDYREEQRAAGRAGMLNLEHLLDKCERVLDEELGR